MTVTLRAILLLTLHWAIWSLLSEVQVFRRSRMSEYVGLLKARAMEIILADFMEQSIRRWKWGSNGKPEGSPEAAMLAAVDFFSAVREERATHTRRDKMPKTELLDLYLRAIKNPSSDSAGRLQERIDEIRRSG